MTELDDILVSGEFAAFRESYASAVHPAGTAAVRETVRRRRRRTAVVTAAAVVLAVAIPVGANAALHRPDPPPGPAQTATPAPSKTSTSPTPPPPTPSTASATPAAPDGRITRSQLLAARLDLAAWPGYAPKTCVSDNVRLRSGPQSDSVPTLLADPRYGDLDGDGATETVALVACRYGEASAKQVLAFDRDGSGRVVTMGRVVGTHDGMDDITDFSVQDHGKIRAHVADIQPCCGTPQWSPQRQWRTYAWTGERFTQTAGPTRFGVDPRLTDLTLTAGDLVVGPPDTKGDRIATVSITVTNKGPVDVPLLGFTDLYLIGEPVGGDLDPCRQVRSDGPGTCALDGLPAGKRKTFTFTFRYDPPEVDEPPTLRVVHYDRQERWWNDLTWKDNQVELRTTG
ncbi:hypothetical protein ACFFMM_16060 [Micromonospora chaiyaphumensis]|uniref:Uncharacterized protein n=1 Tax=Micromonospora chaiyaphumensis TaxID=307119 RepID=A0A1C4WW09_9ACTN|nr:hypothetical protein [Micromonospora chaiyaphumensis]SCF00447.1 hypothetical protein GA0070214_104436 [Micromonospora chaiyaphumensis]